MSGAAVGWLASIVTIAAGPRSFPALIPLPISAFSPTLHRRRIPLLVCCCSCYSSSAMGSAPPEAAGKEIKKLESKIEPMPPPAAPPAAKSPPVTLTPPEKPEPGDCCGSGCVRCVWDVYYEELEAFDKSLAATRSGDDL